MADIIANPSRRPYAALKERILSRFTLPNEDKYSLLQQIPLADLKPSHLLAKMRNIASGLNISEEMLKMIFVKKLPPYIQQIAVVMNDPLETVVLNLDKMMNVPQYNVAATSESEISELKAQIASLTTEIAALRNANREHTYRPRERRQPEHCWYHQKYGRNAIKCSKPCSFISKN